VLSNGRETVALISFCKDVSTMKFGDFPKKGGWGGGGGGGGGGGKRGGVAWG